MPPELVLNTSSLPDACPWSTWTITSIIVKGSPCASGVLVNPGLSVSEVAVFDTMGTVWPVSGPEVYVTQYPAQLTLPQFVLVSYSVEAVLLWPVGPSVVVSAKDGPYSVTFQSAELTGMPVCMKVIPWSSL